MSFEVPVYCCEGLQRDRERKKSEEQEVNEKILHVERKNNAW